MPLTEVEAFRTTLSNTTTTAGLEFFVNSNPTKSTGYGFVYRTDVLAGESFKWSSKSSGKVTVATLADRGLDGTGVGGSGGIAWQSGDIFITTTTAAHMQEVLTELALKADLTGNNTWTGTNTFTQTITAAAINATTVTATFVGNLTGNVTGNASTATTATTATTVTTNANLTGPITSVGNATSIASQTGTGTTFVVQTAPTITSPVLNTGVSGTAIQTGVGGSGSDTILASTRWTFDQIAAATAGVSSLNSLTGSLAITAGAGITVNPSGSNIEIVASGVTSVNSESGVLTITGGDYLTATTTSGNVDFDVEVGDIIMLTKFFS